MAHCPYCKEQLPGAEKICRECFEKLSTWGQLEPPDKRVDPRVAIGAVAVLAIYAAARFFASDALDNINNFLAFTWFVVKFILFAVPAGAAVWDSLKWQTLPRLLLWIGSATALIWFFWWIGDVKRAWNIMFASGFVIWLFVKAASQVKEWLQN